MVGWYVSLVEQHSSDTIASEMLSFFKSKELSHKSVVGN
jgi:hypothetical protein